MKKTIVIYHGNCTDGTTAAAVAYRKFPDAAFFPLSHSYDEEDLDPIKKLAEAGAAIYILDCALGARELLALGHPVVVLDHHAGIKEEMETLAAADKKLTYIFDNEKSGASLAWSYFFPDEPAPDLVKYVEDIDLWNRKLGKDAESVVSYVSMFRNEPEKIAEMLRGDIEGIKQKGEVINAYVHNEIDHLIEMLPREMRVGSYKVPAFNITTHKSMAGSLLSEQLGKAVALYTIKGDSVTISFRSKDGQEPSALTLAELLGGSGHRNASAARPTFEDFIAMIS